MTFDEYQENSKETAIYPAIGHRVIYPVLGLTGEAGEISNKVKKIFRDEEGTISVSHKAELKKELGDVLWYISQIATELDINLDDVAKLNIEKLQSRKERGVLKGDGDNR